MEIYVYIKLLIIKVIKPHNKCSVVTLPSILFCNISQTKCIHQNSIINQMHPDHYSLFVISGFLLLLLIPKHSEQLDAARGEPDGRIIISCQQRILEGNIKDILWLSTSSVYLSFWFEFFLKKKSQNIEGNIHLVSGKRSHF